MAYSVQRAAGAVLALFDMGGLCITQKEQDIFKEHGEARICGFMCKVVNVLGFESCRILVNTSWFPSYKKNYSKPRKKRGFNNPEIDFQIIPTRNKLFFIHYLDLRRYALSLEREQEHWFKQSYWGMQINEQKEDFVWTGGNTKFFPLVKIRECSDMQKIANKSLNISRTV